jgi:hypothetical protein
MSTVGSHDARFILDRWKVQIGGPNQALLARVQSRGPFPLTSLLSGALVACEQARKVT